jgi:hypothetical protein
VGYLLLLIGFLKQRNLQLARINQELSLRKFHLECAIGRLESGEKPSFTIKHNGLPITIEELNRQLILNPVNRVTVKDGLEININPEYER